MNLKIASSPADNDRALLRLVLGAAAVACALALLFTDRSGLAAWLIQTLRLNGLDQAAFRFLGAARPF